MNHSKIILVACISAFVALTTAFLGVAGTIIGSVLSSVLYNVLSEVLEKPVENAKLPKTNFEWDVAYVIPLFVILFIQLMLILAFLSEWGFLPPVFLNIYLSIQGVAYNNLYRILGISLIIMSVYPFILRRNYVKHRDGLIILAIGIIFLIRGFSDIASYASSTFDFFYDYVDFPMAVMAFILLIYVIHDILSTARASEKIDIVKHKVTQKDFKSKPSSKKEPLNLDDLELKQVHSNGGKPYTKPPKDNGNYNSSGTKINESSNDIQFESNDLLDDYRK